MPPQSVLNGTAPLERAQTSGGISGQIDAVDKLFGRKMRLTSIGFRGRPKKAEDVIDFYFSKVSDPIHTLSNDFKKYFQFMKETRKEDMKEKKGGIFKQIHDLAPHFFDFKVWKKITGTARKPEVAALHQIRDILIDVHQLDKDIYGRDPRELFTAVWDQLRRFRKKFAPEEEGKGVMGAIKGTIKASWGVLKESWREFRDEDKRFYDKIWGESGREDLAKELDKKLKSKPLSVHIVSNNSTISKSIDTKLGKANELSDKAIEDADARFRDTELEELQAKGDKKKGPGGILKWLLGAGKGLLASIFAGAASMFGLSKTAVPMLLKTLLKVGTRLGVGGIGLGIAATDVFGKGGAKQLWDEGKIAKSIITGLFGRTKKANEQTWFGSIKDSLKQMIKWAAFGFTVGGPWGALIGGAVGLIGGGATSGLFSKIWEELKSLGLGVISKITEAFSGPLADVKVGKMLGLPDKEVWTEKQEKLIADITDRRKLILKSLNRELNSGEITAEEAEELANKYTEMHMTIGKNLDMIKDPNKFMGLMQEEVQKRIKTYLGAKGAIALDPKTLQILYERFGVKGPALEKVYEQKFGRITTTKRYTAKDIFGYKESKEEAAKTRKAAEDIYIGTGKKATRIEKELFKLQKEIEEARRKIGEITKKESVEDLSNNQRETINQLKKLIETLQKKQMQVINQVPKGQRGLGTEYSQVQIKGY
jgi:hypothetical protein